MAWAVTNSSISEPYSVPMQSFSNAFPKLVFYQLKCHEYSEVKMQIPISKLRYFYVGPAILFRSMIS